MVPGWLLIAILLTSCSATHNETANQSATTKPNPEKPPIASTNVVKVTAQQVVVGKSGSGEAVVKLTIDPGYHINANPPTYPYLKATTLEIPGDQGFSAGPIAYPEAIRRKFAFAEQELAVYEDQAVIKIQLRANKSTKAGEQKIGARLLVQACDDQVCYAPGVIEFGISVNVK